MSDSLAVLAVSNSQHAVDVVAILLVLVVGAVVICWYIYRTTK